MSINDQDTINNTSITDRASSSSSSGIISILPNLVNVYIGTFLCMMGNIGCIGNIIVFQSQAFRSRAYTIYLFAETIFDIFVIDIVLLTRVIEKGYGIPVYNSPYDFICKIRQTGSYYFVLVSFTFFTLATLDRVLCAQRSNSFRKWSNRVTLAYKMVIISILFWFILLCHRLYVYTAVKSKCNPRFDWYDEIDNYIEAVIMEICPLITVFVLAYLLRRSLRNAIERQTNVATAGTQVNTTKRSQLQQIDSQITLMLLLQSIMAIISFLPYGLYVLYNHITTSWNKSTLQVAIEKIIAELTHTLLYTFFASSFHISMISSSGFRREVKRIVLMQKKIHPIYTQAANTVTIQPQY
ncbi:unnamed protein product [Adineta steineri]|uniref:G-protein coupled receptors family 1 profile domain-containing protein n=1 Tax=Adineta steineri TaxID=433720 RepID=A0A819N115_9BILA|nr:unnamed protein product [Adineta steineri]CAF1112001.1 unnamed protein product [Adineta steineri]CAF3708958.1 unnamed protein product [Adineta steineri]CAF3988106.1 unnamed protein product [Adineta steineri]CAF4059047.1 unnamed protein product [Adineta steineri]